MQRKAILPAYGSLQNTLRGDVAAYSTAVGHSLLIMYSCPQSYHVLLKVLSSEFYFHKPITVHLELYFCYHFIHFLLFVGQY